MVEDDAIREAVRKQADVGLQSATDGELRRASWHMDFIYALDGVTKTEGQLAVHFHRADGDIDFTPSAMHVDGRLGVSETIFGDAFRFVQDCADGAVPKLTIPSPSGSLPRRQGRDRSRGVSRARRLLGRLDRRLRRGGAQAR